MSEADYVIWFVVTTVVFAVIIGLGIAGAADAWPSWLRRRGRSPQAELPPEDAGASARHARRPGRHR